LNISLTISGNPRSQHQSALLPSSESKGGIDYDEGPTLVGYGCCNFLPPFEERFCRLGRREFADENKELRAALHQYAERERRIADAGIPTDGDPPAPANLPYPFLIGSVRPEVIIVSFKSHTGSTEKRWKPSAQISISEKY
jgi:hypothetical protein